MKCMNTIIEKTVTNPCKYSIFNLTGRGQKTEKMAREWGAIILNIFVKRGRLIEEQLLFKEIRIRAC